MGKIRVSDLAGKMGVDTQDLLFKLRSIGARVEGEDPEIDTDIIQAILTGKSLAQPSEVIVRDGEAAPPAKRRAPPRRTPRGSMRPQRRRPMIQRVEPRPRILPSTQKKEPEKAATESARETQTPEQVAVEAAAKADRAGAGTAPDQDAATRVTPATPAYTPTPPATDRQPSRPGDRKPRQRPDRESAEHLRAYRGTVEEAEKEQERFERVGASTRGRRRAERRVQTDSAEGELLAFKGGHHFWRFFYFQGCGLLLGPTYAVYVRTRCLPSKHIN